MLITIICYENKNGKFFKWNFWVENYENGKFSEL